MRRLLPVLALVALLTACEAKVTQENYDRIDVGMAQSTVMSILGEGTRQDVAGTGIGTSGLMERDSDASSRSTYMWDEDGMQIIVDFEDQKVVSKRKSGF